MLVLFSINSVIYKMMCEASSVLNAVVRQQSSSSSSSRRSGRRGGSSSSIRGNSSSDNRYSIATLTLRDLRSLLVFE